jgi:hypothetical protein
VVAVLLAGVGAAQASAVPAESRYDRPTSTYDVPAYAYDAPAELSSPDTVTTYVRGSPSGPEAVSWGRSVSVSACCSAANSAPAVSVTERTAPQALKPSEAAARWDEFLGEGPHTNIHPRTGLPDPDRIVSADGMRSIRFGIHEMGSSPTRFHFHEETWNFDTAANTWFVDNVLVRVPFPKGAW